MNKWAVGLATEAVGHEREMFIVLGFVGLTNVLAVANAFLSDNT